MLFYEFKIWMTLNIYEATVLPLNFHPIPILGNFFNLAYLGGSFKIL